MNNPSPDGRLRVLLAVTRMVRGGAQREVLQLLARLDRTRFHVSLMCHPEGEWVEEAAALADAYHPIPDLVRPLSPRRDLRAFGSALRVLRGRRFDVVHTHTAKAGVIVRAAARMAGVPVVLHTPHGTVYHDCFLSPPMQRVIALVERLAARRTSYILTKSIHEAEEYVRLRIAPPSRFITLYSGLDLSRLLPSESRGRAARAALGIEPTAPMILYAARFAPEKNHAMFLNAFRKVLQEAPSAVAVLAGEGPLRREIEGRGADLIAAGRLLSLGFRGDVPDLMRAADVCVSASLTEGLPLAVVEALALGRPVAATDAGGTREVVKHGGTGLLIPPGEADALAEAVLQLIRDPELARQLGERGRLAVRRLFDVETMVSRTADLYQRLWLASRRTAAHTAPIAADRP